MVSIGDMEFRLRSRGIVPQESLGTCTIIGVGAIGSQVAIGLARLGVPHIVLVDFDTVDDVNIGIQGFNRDEIDSPKVEAIRKRIEAIDKEITVSTYEEKYNPLHLVGTVFSCVDSIKVRRRIVEGCSKENLPYIDCRMSSQSFQVYTARDPGERILYSKSLFPSIEAYREGCTSRGTIYCAMICAGYAIAAYKGIRLGEEVPLRFNGDVLNFDTWEGE